MIRFDVVKDMVSLLGDDCISIFFGKGLCREAYEDDKKNNFYIESEFVSPSFALGVALGTEKRVFAFIDDSMFISNIGDLFQSAVSKCRNLFFVVVISGYYQDKNYMPTIFKDITAPKGILFNMGFLVHDYTNYLKKSEKYKLSDFLKKTNGPVAIMITVDKGLNSNLDDLNYSPEFLKSRIVDFINSRG